MPRAISVLFVPLMAAASVWMLPAVDSDSTTTASQGNFTNAMASEAPTLVAEACSCIQGCEVQKQTCNLGCRKGGGVAACVDNCEKGYDACVQSCKRTSPNC